MALELWHYKTKYQWKIHINLHLAGKHLSDLLRSRKIGETRCIGLRGFCIFVNKFFPLYYLTKWCQFFIFCSPSKPINFIAPNSEQFRQSYGCLKSLEYWRELYSTLEPWHLIGIIGRDGIWTLILLGYLMIFYDTLSDLSGMRHYWM